MKMKQFLISSAVILFLCSTESISWAQKVNYQISSEVNDDLSRSILISHDEYGTVTFLMSFYSLTNSDSPKRQTSTIKKSGEAARFYPVNPVEPIRYKTSLIYSDRGKLDATVDTNFVYRLPFSLTKQAQLLDPNLFPQDFQQDNAFSFGLTFELNPSDTIFAVRKGIVTKILEKYAFSETESDPLNVIFIEHDDGSVAGYTPLHKNSVMVKAGQTVFPGTPLAFPEKSYQGKVLLNLKIYNPVTNPTRNIEKMILRKYYDPLFSTPAGNVHLAPGRKYQPACSPEIITREMTPKQKQLFDKGKLKP